MITREFDLTIRVPQQDYIDTGIKLVQNDQGVYVFNLRITDGITDIDYNQVDRTTIIFKKRDGNVVQGNLEPTGNGYRYMLGTNEIACPGKVIASIQLYGALDERLTTARFAFEVVQDLIDPSMVESTTEFDALTKAISLMEELEERLEDFPNIKVLGTYPTLADLLAAHPDGSGLDGGYFVVENGEFYIWSTVTNQWESLGTIKGPKGDQGPQGEQGPAGPNNIYNGLDSDATDYALSAKQGKVLKDELDTHKADGTQHAKTARFVIGTSTTGWTAKDCDYLCDGTNDQEEIQNAINALPATGGEVVILDGTYNITAKIDVTKDNVSIRGNGNATILKRMFNSASAEGVITLTSRSGCKISNLQIDGNGTMYVHVNNYGIYLSGSNNNTVIGNICNNNRNGIYLTSSNNNTVTGNTCNNNNNYGIYLSSSNNNTITSNTCNNNNDGIYLSYSNDSTITSNTCNNNDRYGIYLTSSNNNTVTGNTCNNNSVGIDLSSGSNNTVTGNTCNNNNRGIYLSSSNSTITGNTCNNNNTEGINLSGSRRNTVTGNTCIRGTGQTTDYTESQHTIRLSGTGNSYNLISNNNCMGKAVTNEGGTGNTLVNNKFDAT